MTLGGCGNGADGRRADQFNEGSTGQRHQHEGRPLDWEGNGNANRSGSGNHDANASGSQRSWKGIKDNNLYDPWNHAWPYYGGFDCMYCSLKHKGGGATRVAEHLGGIVGNVRSCPNVPRNVRDAMREVRNESKRKKRDKQNTRLRIEKFRQDWKNFGVTLMCDSWTGPTGMSLINFMVYCNTRMFFLNTIDASGQTQNSDFIYREIEKVVEEIGHEHIVQIVTDNGSNYKKACKTLIEEPKYSHIVWQPCAAHTVNLMLKDIAKFSEIDVIVKSAKTICSFLHKHNNLHDNMKKNIGGELIRPNATRFGTVFMFLESYHLKKDKFREWMVSNDWKDCHWRYEPGYVFAEECLSSNVWWNALEWVLGSLRPLYKAMRYADTQKQCTLSGFKKSMMLAIQRMEAHLGPTSRLYLSFMRKVGKRIDAMEEDTFMVAAAVLDPYTHYKLNLCNHTDYATSLTDAIAKILDPKSALSAIDEVSKFRERQGRFGTRLAEEAAARMQPTQWWFQFGGDVPALQKCAMRICSQCVSSSGCERNWSAFALVHTKQRNRLLYDKLHKLVSVRYNLKIRAEEDQERDMDKEIDPSALLMDTTMFDETNPIMEWLNEDEEDTIIDGADAASAVFEKIRRLNSSRNASYVGKGDKNKRKRNNDEENEYVDTESEDDVEENEFVDSESEDNGGVSESEEDDPSMQDEQEAQMQVEKETQIQVEKEAPPSGGNLETRRSVRLVKKKTKDVNSLYS